MTQDVKKQGVQCILLNASPKVVKSLSGLNHDLWLANSSQELLQLLTKQNVTGTACFENSNINRNVTNKLY